MKIGIQTQPLTTNYGGILQNYALQTILRRFGHEVVTFDLLKYTWFDWSRDFLKNIIRKLIGRKPKIIVTPPRKDKKEKPLRTFVHKNINLTTRVRRLSKPLVESYKIDTLVVGSDQVWRPIYNYCIEDMFFKYAERLDVKKIAYAASFGTEHWEFSQTQTANCAALAKKIQAISVREDSGVGLCEKYLGVNATHVLDPTLLLTSDDYDVLCKCISKREPFVFAYVLDINDRKIADIKSFAEARELPYIIKSAGSNILENDSVELWLSYFRDAAFVITDSFHGTAFSINYSKDFLVYTNSHRGNSRFESLLTLFNLKHRVVENIDSFITPIDWEEVNVILSTERLKSMSWLHNSLN